MKTEFSKNIGNGISIIIFIKHNTDTLKHLLFNFFPNNKYPPIEFIIVDQDVTGKTARLVKEYSSKTFFRLIKKEKSDLSLAFKKIVTHKACYKKKVFVKISKNGLEWSNEILEGAGNISKKGNTDLFLKWFSSSLENSGSRDESHQNSQNPLNLNVLVVNKGRMETNSGYHVKYYTERLCSLGVNCVVAVPTMDDNEISQKLPFEVRTYKDILQNGLMFQDGRGPDIVHAWTPREKVRQFCHKIARQYIFKTIIHLEDNEEYLTENAVGMSYSELSVLPLKELDLIIPQDRFHPIRGWEWLKQASGLSFIIDTLQRFNPNGLPSIILPAPVDESLFFPRPINYELRKQLNIPENHLVLAYIGNVRQLKKQEALSLYKSVAMLNEQGIPATVIRTGQNYVPLNEDGSWYQKFEKPLGWVNRNQVPEILAAADILVQPGWPGPFDDQRMPAKLTEYFAMGRPVILPRTNLGLKVNHGKEAWVVERADAEGITQAVKQIKDDPTLKYKLSEGSVDFYLQKLADQRLSKDLLNYYQNLISRKVALKTPVIEKNFSFQPDKIKENKKIHIDITDPKYDGNDFAKTPENYNFLLTGTTPGSKEKWNLFFNSLQSKLGRDLEIISCMEHAIQAEYMPQNKPWIGFIHAMPVKVPEWLSIFAPYNKVSNLNFFQSKSWDDAKKQCKGLYVFSKEHADRVRSIAGVGVNVVQKPVQKIGSKWSWQAFNVNKNKKIIQVGWWLQRPHAIFVLPVLGINKLWLKSAHPQAESIFKAEKEHLKSRYIYFDFMMESVKIIENYDAAFYEQAMSENIAFVHYYDGNSLDLVLECIARHTPFLVNPHASIREYLGNEYPLYYYFYKDAADKACDDSLLYKAHEYLKVLDDKYFSDIESSLIDQIRKTI